MTTLTKKQLAHLSDLPGPSAQIRYLDSLNWTRAAIAKFLGKRYQHVRNVLTNPLVSPK